MIAPSPEPIVLAGGLAGQTWLYVAVPADIEPLVACIVEDAEANRVPWSIAWPMLVGLAEAR